jgi:hypothetical protein
MFALKLMVYSSFPYLSPWGNTHILVAWQVRFLFMPIWIHVCLKSMAFTGKTMKIQTHFFTEMIDSNRAIENQWFFHAFPINMFDSLHFFPHENPQVSCSQVGSWTWRTSPAMHSASLLGACVSRWWDMAMV